MMISWTQGRRELDYLRLVGASNETAKEVQLFHLAPWLTARYQRVAEIFHREKRDLAIRHAIGVSLLTVISTAGYYGAYVVIVSQTVAGILTLGSMAMLAAAFMRGRDLIQSILSSVTAIYDESLYLKDLFQFLQLEPSILSRPGASAVPFPIQDGFVFEDVGFRYPGSDRWAIRHVSFGLRRGERVALVGENGAGKTTITKLLTRLYDPTEGRILLDGRDLRTYDLTSLRRAIGVIFQDFVQYDFRFEENVGVGEIGLVQSYLDQTTQLLESVRRPNTRPGRRNKPAASDTASLSTSARSYDVPKALREACEKSQAAAILPRMPHGWRQMLLAPVEN